LVRDHGWVRVALADPLKRIAKDVYDFTDEQLWGPSSARNAPDRRYPKTERAKAFAKETTALLDSVWREVLMKEFGEEAAKHFLTPREFLQKLGTECGRECYDNTWIDKTIRTADALLGEAGPDLRYTAQRGLYELGRALSFSEEEQREAARVKGVAVPDVRFKNEMAAIRDAGGLLIRVKRTAATNTAWFSVHASEREQLDVPDSYFDYVAQNDGPLEDLPQRVAEMMTVLRSRL
jgi:hypothetical protein